MAEHVVKKGDTAVVILIDEAGGEMRFRQEQDSVLKLYVIRINRRGEETVTADNIFVEQQGEHCQTEIYALNYLCGNSTASLHTHVSHDKGKGASRQLVKFILDDNAKGEFYGEFWFVTGNFFTPSKLSQSVYLQSFLYFYISFSPNISRGIMVYHGEF